MKEVLIYGLSRRMLARFSWLKEMVHITAFSDTNPNRKENIPDKSIPYVLPSEIDSSIYDYIVICSVFFEEIKEDLVNRYGIEESKIVTDHDVYINMLYENKHSFGNKHKDKEIVIIGRNLPTNGIIGHLCGNLEYLKMILDAGKYPVIDMKNFENAYLEDHEKGIKNAWEYYFEQPTEISLDEAYESANVTIVPDINVVSDGRYSIQRSFSNKEIRAQHYELFQKHYKIKNNIMSQLKEEYEQLFTPIKNKNHKIMGLLYRGTDYVNLKPYRHNKSPKLDDFIAKISELIKYWDYKYLYFTSEDQSAVDKIKETFGNRVITRNRKRFTDTGEKLLYEIPFNREHDKYKKGYDYLADIWLLSKCDSLISCKVAGGLGALIMNGCKYEHEYIFDLGQYGID